MLVINITWESFSFCFVFFTYRFYSHVSYLLNQNLGVMHTVGTWEYMFLKRKEWDERKSTSPEILIEIQLQKLPVQMTRLLSSLLSMSSLKTEREDTQL